MRFGDQWRSPPPKSTDYLLMPLQAAIIRELHSLGTPNMIECVAVGAGDEPFLCTAPLGRTLNRLDPGEVIISAVAAAARTVLHMAGLDPPWVHRDLSLGNLIIALGHGEPILPDGHTYIIDWATAVRTTPNCKACGPGELTGTYVYMALSVLEGHAHTTSSDLESLAMIVVHLACDTRAPWAWATTADTMLDVKGSQLRLRWDALCRDYMKPRGTVPRDAAQRLHALFWPSTAPCAVRRYNANVTPQQFLDALQPSDDR